MQSKEGEVEEAVKYAIDVGYRHIDTASFYENEAEIGNAVREKIKEGVIKREDIFITTKVLFATILFTQEKIFQFFLLINRSYGAIVTKKAK